MFIQALEEKIGGTKMEKELVWDVLKAAFSLEIENSTINNNEIVIYFCDNSVLKICVSYNDKI